ncbi:sushi, von Willebrand factor type A, EGF and pentraxin domain-containing protein 1-like [Bolinopsis microptera]|uniref:sushi, von Willebrand factor type A, EGF and pentraxin domain-containing protein 1-like n=1 Tax=Bolinopsis microptera TaxID=2820187 RepID=UPI003079CE9E
MPTSRADCTFTYNFQVIVQKGVSYFHDLDLTNEDNNLTVRFGVGEYITVKCVEGYQFVNGIRKVDGVNTFSLDHDEGLKISCEVGNNMKPDISKTVLGYDRYLFCDEGCPPVREDKYKVSYPAAIVTSEDSSPPITYLKDSFISFSCQPGYTIATGNVGSSKSQCKKSTEEVNWSPKKEDFINCVRGCPDITRSVSGGVTTDVPNSTPNQAPFKPGDTVTFSCEPGHVLVGYSTLTCTGLLKWNENSPECVKP